MRQYGTLLSEHYRYQVFHLYCRCFCVRLILKERDYERLPKFGTTQPYYRYSQWNKTTEVWRPPRVAKCCEAGGSNNDGDGMGWSLTMKQHETPENMEQQQLAFQPSASFILPCRNRHGGCAVADVAHGKGRGWQGKLRNISKKRTDSHGFLWISTVFYCIFFLMILMDFHTFITFFYPGSIWECSVTYPTCDFAPGGSMPSVKNTHRTDAAHGK